LGQGFAKMLLEAHMPVPRAARQGVKA
jgi:hypothetical protein